MAAVLFSVLFLLLLIIIATQRLQLMKINSGCLWAPCTWITWGNRGTLPGKNVGRCWKIWFGVEVKLRFSCLEVQLDLWCKVPASTHHDTAWLWASILNVDGQKNKKTGSGKNICILYIVLFFSTTSPSKKHQLLKNLTTPHWVDPTVPGEARNGELLNLGISQELSYNIVMIYKYSIWYIKY